MLVRFSQTLRRKVMTTDDQDWQRERAMEAGMLHGIDAYNEIMGYDTRVPYIPAPDEMEECYWEEED